MIELGSRGPRIRGHHTSLRRGQKKRKLLVGENEGIIGKDVSVLSGGEVIEQEGKQKHWQRLSLGSADHGMAAVDGDERIGGNLPQ